jgi:hypothetical protein
LGRSSIKKNIRFIEEGYMTGARNYAEEIAERNRRLLRRTKRWKQVERVIHPLIGSFQSIKDSDLERDIKVELYRFIPIRSIACLEGWFKLAVASLIDESDSFRENASRIKEPRINIGDVLLVHSKKLSGGELIAHTLPVNRLNDIEDVLSLIIDSDFSEAFKNVRINPKTAPNPVTFKKEAMMIYHNVKKTFYFRHIFAHELATSMRVSAQQYEDCVFAVFMYLVGAERVVQDLLGETI